MRIEIEQIKVLAKYTFLAVVSTPAEQKVILSEPFLSMGSRMVMALPWTSDFDANAMKTAKAPVWIDRSSFIESCF